jgi:hypothetical protein
VATSARTGEVRGSRDTRTATVAAVAAVVAAGTAQISAQIEADRRNRIWEKQAVAYTDAITGIMHRQKFRDGQLTGIITGTDGCLTLCATVALAVTVGSWVHRGTRLSRRRAWPWARRPWLRHDRVRKAGK